MHHKKVIQNILLLTALLSAPLYAQEISVDILQLNHDQGKQGIGEKIGTVTFSDSPQGLKIKTQLKGLSPGAHGFHIHENPSCEGNMNNGQWEMGAKAGGHLDPDQTAKHAGPEGSGHIGDLPFLAVNDDGNAELELSVKRLSIDKIKNHSVVIHQGSDNYSDQPKPMGGGGDRIACGVI